jgi:hypothetical protein
VLSMAMPKQCGLRSHMERSNRASPLISGAEMAFHDIQVLMLHELYASQLSKGAKTARVVTARPVAGT